MGSVTAFFQPSPHGGLEATYTVHLRLIGKILERIWN